ncbi:hypothetical protein [Litoribrevibacter albus]|uniref:Uncharacterized protein n=1 Tax=Litoribrevibacter albus TaxID=1473156 RepID=A0AA37W5V3_9GAMM|nr:hypothetical protein [Litoribrevibacter albus]GLQ30970.1 hypothetical protein GCM10007876_14490 [Litoribrevibacter albus]
MRGRDLKHIRVGNEVFLKTQVLKNLSKEIGVLVDRMATLYASGNGVNEVVRLERMIQQRADVINQLTDID